MEVSHNGNGSGDNTPGPVPHETVYRCDTEGCKSPVLAKHIQQGGCPKCGGRRMKVAVCITDEEETWLAGEGYIFKDEGWSDEPYLKKR